jgi:hypothetical protein
MNDDLRENIGRALYHALNRDTFAILWVDLPDNRRERYRMAAELFAISEQLDEWLERMRHRIAA